MLNLFKRSPLKTIDKVSLDKEIENYSLSGITGDEKGLIISLTSFPQRMYEIHYTLYSLLTQSVKPAAKACCINFCPNMSYSNVFTPSLQR